MTFKTREEVRERLGNIDQIRDIIFGSQIRDYENRFVQIESDISRLQQEMRSQVEQLKSSFSIEIKAATEALDKKIKSIALTTQEESVDLRQQIDRLNRKFSSGIQSLDEALDIQTTSVRQEASQTKIQLEDDIKALRDLVLEEMERHFSQLSKTKVSKDDIAETLFALGMRLKETEFIPMLREASDEINGYNSTQILKANGEKFSDMLSRSHSSNDLSS